MALVALGELSGDVFAAGALHHLLIEAHISSVEQRAVAPDPARLEDGGADGQIQARQADAFLDVAGGMADLQAEIPACRVFDDALASVCL